jgi:hypothetical protein
MQHNRVPTNTMEKNSFSSGKIARGLIDWLRNVLTIRKGADPSQQSNQEMESGERETAGADVTFLGWQKGITGDPIALFNVMAKHHPLFRSTVSEQTLRDNNLAIPPTTRQQEEGKGFDLD